jgi:hypothetical protein
VQGDVRKMEGRVYTECEKDTIVVVVLDLPSARQKNEGRIDVSADAAHWSAALSNAMQCFQVRVTFPSTSQVNEPSPSIISAWATDE